MKYVTISKLSDLSGYSEKALRRKVEDGVFREGVHYRYAPDGRIHFSVEAYERWVEGDTPASKTTAAISASASNGRAVAGGSR